MAHIGLTMTIAVIAIVLTVSFQEAFALKCWDCDNSRHPFCGYPFEEKKLNKSLLVDCPPIGGDAVCLKIVRSDQFISRKCVNNKNNVNGLCWVNDNRGGPAGKAPFCKECSKDGCNGATQYGPAAMIVAIPIAIMKLFSLF